MSVLRFRIDGLPNFGTTSVPDCAWLTSMFDELCRALGSCLISEVPLARF